MNANKLIENIENRQPNFLNIVPEEKLKYISGNIIDSIKFDFGDISTCPVKEGEIISIPKLPFENMYCELINNGLVEAFTLTYVDNKIMAFYCLDNKITGVSLLEDDQHRFKYHVVKGLDDYFINNNPGINFQHLINGICYSIACLMRFIQIMNCSNVVIKNNLPPEKVNKKRAKKGKPPLFEYKTLELTSINSKSNEHQGGTHASPRWHLRRGHIRHLQNGNEIWINDCSVGSVTKGIINKDYKFKAGEQA